MSHQLLRAAVLALALLPLPVAAQTQAGKTIVAPMINSMPSTAIYCDDGTGKAAICSFGGGSGSSGPARSSSTSTNGMIATANVYQTVLPSNASRNGCVIYNKGISTMLFFAGARASATDAASIPIEPGQYYSCSSGTIVITDEISVKSPTASDTFAVVSQ